MCASTTNNQRIHLLGLLMLHHLYRLRISFHFSFLELVFHCLKKKEKEKFYKIAFQHIACHFYLFEGYALFYYFQSAVR